MYTTIYSRYKPLSGYICIFGTNTSNSGAPEVPNGSGHWYRTYCSPLKLIEYLNPDKLDLLTSCISSPAGPHIAEYEDHDKVTGITIDPYVCLGKICTRHILAAVKQMNRQSVDKILRKLKSLEEDHSYRSSAGEGNLEYAICDDPIVGIYQNHIMRHLWR